MQPHIWWCPVGTHQPVCLQSPALLLARPVWADAAPCPQECSAAARTKLPDNLAAALRAISRSLQGPTDGLPQSVPGDQQLTPDQVKKLWLPLLRLRQACCHPQVRLLPLAGPAGGKQSCCAWYLLPCQAPHYAPAQLGAIAGFCGLSVDRLSLDGAHCLSPACAAQVGAGGLKTLQASKAPMSMDEILQACHRAPCTAGCSCACASSLVNAAQS